MKHAEEYREQQLVRPLVERLLSAIDTLPHPIRIMEVCGTHTMAIFQSGLKSLLPAKVELVSGPGCPVCVTAASQMDCFINIADAREYKGRKIRLAIFGDLFRVPGTNSSLAEVSAQGAQVQIVYSPMDALILARKNPDELVVFAGVGFETTTPTIAATILAAAKSGVENLVILCAQKTMFHPLIQLFSDPDLRLDGLLCPGHVALITGLKPWEDLASRFHLPSVVAGFEPADLLKAIIMLVTQIQKGEAKVQNGYPRAVSATGNTKAQQVVDEVFEPCDTVWRGLGMLAESGLAIREKYARFDGALLFPEFTQLTTHDSKSPRGCRCGEVLQGRLQPTECALFGSTCMPMKPIGPCMVSSEGVCAAHYKYGEGL